MMQVNSIAVFKEKVLKFKVGHYSACIFVSLNVVMNISSHTITIKKIGVTWKLWLYSLKAFYHMGV